MSGKSNSKVKTRLVLKSVIKPSIDDNLFLLISVKSVSKVETRLLL